MKSKKHYFLFIIVTFFSGNLYSQEDSTIYFDADWKSTVKNSAVYYKKATFNEYGKIDGVFKDYYMSSGKIQNKGEYINGKKDSYSVWYYENGKKKEIGEYVDHQYVISKAWNKDGTCILKKGTGFRQYFFYNGVIKSEGNYLKGYKEGKWIYYFNNGKINSQEFFKYGIKDGPQVYLNIMGDTASLEIFSRGERSGEWKYWYPNKSVKSINNYYEGKLNGTQIKLKENGDVLEMKFYNNGILVSGDGSFYNKDFKKIENDSGAAFYTKKFAIEGSDHSIEKIFFISGKLYSESQYSIKGLNGATSRWYENGNIQYKAYYKDGKLDGSVESFFENGKPRRSDTYKNGELVKGSLLSINGQDTIHTVFKIWPEFPGGVEAMYHSIYANVKYPPEAQKYRYEGTVYVSFLVNANGQISDVKINNKNANEECLNNAALDAIKKMPNWIFTTPDAIAPTYLHCR